MSETRRDPEAKLGRDPAAPSIAKPSLDERLGCYCMSPRYRAPAQSAI